MMKKNIVLWVVIAMVLMSCLINFGPQQKLSKANGLIRPFIQAKRAKTGRYCQRLIFRDGP